MMILSDLMMLAQQCAPSVSPATMTAIVRTESAFNPYAIGVVGGRLVRQPASLDEAIATARALDAGKWNYSVGLAQVSRSNWSRLGLNVRDAFDVCRNLAAGASVLQRCFQLAGLDRIEPQQALRNSLSCYTSGNFSEGYRTGYVQRVLRNASLDLGLNAVPVAAQGAPPTAASSTEPGTSARLLPTVPAIAPSVSPIPVVPIDASGLPNFLLLERHRQTGDLARTGSDTTDAPRHERHERDEGDGHDERHETPDSSAVVF